MIIRAPIHRVGPEQTMQVIDLQHLVRPGTPYELERSYEPFDGIKRRPAKRLKAQPGGKRRRRKKR